MNVVMAGIGMESSVRSVIGGGGLGWIEGLSVVGLLLFLGGLRSARRAPVYVVRDFGRRM